MSDRHADAVGHWLRERADQHAVSPLTRAAWPHSGIDIKASDWDQLIVLDGCRADLFEETADLSQFDAYDRVYSRGSSTCEWVEANFGDEANGGIEYYTANPIVAQNVWTPSFTRFKKLYRKAITDTLHAKELRKAVRINAPDYDRHRVVIHCLEPHAPFHAAEWFSHDYETPWRALRGGEKSRSEVWRAYKDNLEYGLKHMMKLAEKLPGRTVITSDHGQLLGERVVGLKTYGHPRGMRHEDLCAVPWAVIDETTETTTDSGAVEHEPTDPYEQLEAMGYR